MPVVGVGVDASGTHALFRSVSTCVQEINDAKNDLRGKGVSVD